MKIISHDIFKEHDTGMHPENRKRLDSLGSIPQTEIEEDESILSMIHKDSYIEKVRNHSSQGNPLDGDTRVSTGSFKYVYLEFSCLFR